MDPLQSLQQEWQSLVGGSIYTKEQPAVEATDLDSLRRWQGENDYASMYGVPSRVYVSSVTRPYERFHWRLTDREPRRFSIGKENGLTQRANPAQIESPEQYLLLQKCRNPFDPEAYFFFCFF